jgi:sortase A
VFYRAVGLLGRTVFTAGALLLLFVAYQLWGTGLAEARAQDRLEAEFMGRVATLATPPTSTSSTTSVVAPTSTSPAVTSTTTLLSAPVSGPSTAARLSAGEPVAQLRIPTIGVDKVVIEGTAVADLRKGPGHYTATARPGQAGNVAIAGHRTTYGAPFADLDRLVPSDKIVLTTLHGEYTYEVLAAPQDPTHGHFIVAPEDVWVLGDFGDNRLTLTACHPKLSASQRIIVVAKLVPGPSPQLAPRPEVAPTSASATTAPSVSTEAGARPPAPPALSAVDQGLGGDPQARGSVIGWGAVLLVLFVAVTRTRKRWRHWYVTLATAVPTLLVLFVWFQQLDRWMPAR